MARRPSTRRLSTRLHEDPGLQPERTALSWGRTVLALLVCASTLLRWAGMYPSVIVVLALVLALLAVTLLLAGHHRYQREAHSLAKERVQPNVVAVLLVTACMVTVGGAELVLLLGALIERL
ncbi:DUF202 domain-containing protein [Corynebacterium uterequi]|uniref:Putative membrane protein n=1 Tax=Corynebacterium uterequi TaxID=1072256 RepID=A0A0G3HJR1_9CORY|nr:DUF202 domain-containing protein [Corynebacterium uterequi]AKK12158.1 putative membrane protein [Corynebacterium uterequi]